MYFVMISIIGSNCAENNWNMMKSSLLDEINNTDCQVKSYLEWTNGWKDSILVWSSVLSKVGHIHFWVTKIVRWNHYQNLSYVLKWSLFWRSECFDFQANRISVQLIDSNRNCLSMRGLTMLLAFTFIHFAVIKIIERNDSADSYSSGVWSAIWYRAIETIRWK